MSLPLPQHAARVLLLASFSSASVLAQQTPAQALAEWEVQGRADGLARPDTECQDFLQAMGRKPPELQYVSCSQDDVSYIKPMEAHYVFQARKRRRSKPICTRHSACLHCATSVVAGATAHPTTGAKVRMR
nr:DUF4952 domain-containing protein [Stenotrophomonas geniculata]